jgi:hypothetical protein
MLQTYSLILRSLKNFSIRAVHRIAALGQRGFCLERRQRFLGTRCEDSKFAKQRHGLPEQRLRQSVLENTGTAGNVSWSKSNGCKIPPLTGRKYWSIPDS